VSGKDTMQMGGKLNMSTSKDKDAELELEYYGWRTQYGEEEAIRIAAEEWGTSEVQVKLKIQKWEDNLWL